MNRLQEMLNLNELPSVRDHFDIVAGTGTGAVIACLVGRLGVPVKRVVEYYARLAKVFSDRKILGRTTYKTTKLKEVLRAIVKDITGDEDTPMMDMSKDGEKCRTIVFAMSAHNMDASVPCLFRSYRGATNQMPDCPIWQALGATMAHPEMFKPIMIGPPNLEQAFIDGGLGCNNPTAHVLAEVKGLFPGRHVSSVVSIGAGHPETISLSDGSWFPGATMSHILDLTKQISQEAERVAEEMDARFRAIPGVYFRLSVSHGLQSLGVHEWHKADRVFANARAYMSSVQVKGKIEEVVNAVILRDKAIATEHIDGEIQPGFTNRATGVKICPAPSPVFTGRQDEIDKIVTCISHGDTQRCVFVLYGLGGVGKTQLALKTVEQTRGMWTDVIFVDGTTDETATTTLAGFAKEKKIGDSYESALKWLSNADNRWLMVIDNADDPKVDIRRYFPDGHTGSILITTRIEQYAMLAQGQDPDFQVLGMRPQEGMQLLLKTAKRKDLELPEGEHEAAAQLLENLGYLALAIVQAGAYIFCSKCTIAQYLEMFTEHREATLERSTRLPIRVDQYEKSVYTTWHMSYVLLSHNAQRLLHLMSFMHNNGIVQDTFRRAAMNLSIEPEYPAAADRAKIRSHVKACLEPYISPIGAWDLGAFLDTVTELLSYSLISSDWTNGAYDIHVLVHDWASTVTGHPAEVATEHTALLLAASVDYLDTMESLTYKCIVEIHISRLLERQPQTSVYNATRFAEVYRRAGKWKQQEKMLLIQLDGTRRTLGEMHDSTLIGMNNLANAYLQQGRHDEAVALLQQTLEVRRLVSGDEHRQTLILMQNLSRTYYALGRYNDAEALQSYIMKTSAKVRGKEHTDTLTSMHELAVTYNALDRYDEAEALLVRAIDIRKRVSGDEHPRTMGSMHVLASSYYFQGRLDEAARLQEHVSSINQRRFGEEHPNTVATMNELAATYCARGEYKRAEEMQIKVLDAWKRVHSEEHPHTLIAMDNLSNTYRYQGRYLEAEELGKQVVDARKRVLGMKHPRTLLGMRNLLKTYEAMGEIRQNEYNALKMEVDKLDDVTN